MDTDQFAALGRAYEETLKLPLRRYLEIPGLLDAIGDTTGLSVLDIGCGTGAYTRLLKGLGANRVVGLDASPGMLQAARDIEHVEQSGIDYVHGDVSEAAGLGEFDLVTAVYVLPYADSRDRLDAMLQAIHTLVGENGRFVTLTINPDFSTD